MLTSKRKFIMSGFACLALSACQAPQAYTVVAGYPAQELTPSTSVLAQTCNGSHDTKGLNVRGQTLTIVKVKIKEIVGGVPQDFTHTWAPADTAYSRWTKAVYTGLPGKPSCGGLSLNTIVLNRSSGWLLRWELEMADMPGTPGVHGLPSDAWYIDGEFPIVNGVGTQEIPFQAHNGRSFIATVTSEQGPLWKSMEIQRQADEDGTVKYPSFGRQLPDEKSTLTIEDLLKK
jgi:hypothetical protein